MTTEVDQPSPTRRFLGVADNLCAAVVTLTAVAWAAVASGRVRGESLGVLLSGSNIDMERFRNLLAED